MDRKERKAVVWKVIYIVSAVVIALIFCGCKTKVVTVEKVHDVYHNVTDTIRDSIKHVVKVKEFVKGDTVYQYHTEYLYKDRWKVHDSIIIQRDSVPYPVEVIKEVEKRVTPWYNWLLIGGLLLAVLYLLFKRLLDKD